MRLIFLIAFIASGFLRAQDLGSQIIDSISYTNTPIKTDSLSIDNSRIFSLDSILKPNETPAFRVKTKEDLAKNDKYTATEFLKFLKSDDECIVTIKNDNKIIQGFSSLKESSLAINHVLRR